jgi:hypothetical protein
MERIYNFAIIRISPDPRRGELINIGVVVFLRGRLDVRILPSLAKVQALHGDLDLLRLYELPEIMAVYSKLKKSVQDRYDLIKHIGMVELSEIGGFRANDESTYDRAVEELMVNLVKPTVGVREKISSVSPLFNQVRKIIKEAKMLGRGVNDIENHKIVQRYPLDKDKGLYADFAGKNSRFYVTETLDYRVDRGIDGTKFNESAKAALVLREAAQKYDNSKRIVIYAVKAQMEEKLKPHLNLLSEFGTDFINFESSSDRARYIMQVATAFGGELPLSTNQVELKD